MLTIFNSLLTFIQQKFDASLINIDEGLFTKKAYLNVGNITLVLEHHDDIGNYFYSNDLNSKEVTERLSRILESTLHNCLYD